MSRFCRDCKVELTDENWYVVNQPNRSYVCKQCAVMNRRKSRGVKDFDQKKYNELFEKQKGCCAICGKHQSELEKTLHVDHDHKTGKVRGLLCQRCNQALGYFYVDNKGTELLTSAINFLKNNE